jgi:hypothetical protein
VIGWGWVILQLAVLTFGIGLIVRSLVLGARARRVGRAAAAEPDPRRAANLHTQSSLGFAHASSVAALGTVFALLSTAMGVAAALLNG